MELFETIKNAKDVLNVVKGQSSKDFDEKVFNNVDSLVPGDLLLRKMKDCWKYHHVGIYCGNNEVIHFSAPQGKEILGSMRISQSPLPDEDGEIHKITVKKFNTGQDLKVFRLKENVPRNLHVNIMNAMEMCIPYHLLSFNCVHFALCILEKIKWPAQSRSEDGATPEENQALNPAVKDSEERGGA
ncbi:hypothetical protein AMEX_G20381 [Astyanax mexicanus]|uniref:LRAT domain-containing protein n=1 Tax=Astyanax mexicanus TaxID=7994 RepID=A0A8T2L7C6_ASTMX|nr:hypothetical protein AMEX_G20381 [Astyanax mexicanus]